MGAIDTSTITVVAPLLIVGLVGASLLVRARRATSIRSVASQWPRTMGTVLSSTVQVGHGGGSRNEQPLVYYAYQVNGEVFQGHRVRVGRIPSSASSTIARYPAGSPVVVYYDPSDPRNSALEF